MNTQPTNLDGTIATPLDHIEAAFQKPDPALMPYFTIGYPDYETSLEVIETCAEAGADLMELGVPFSDPLADGPTIQHSSQVALEHGISLQRCIEAVADLRARGVRIPFILMSYYNPILAFGVPAFVDAAAAAGSHGFIIPDLPPEEATELIALCRRHALGLSFMLAPNSTDDRIRKVTAVSSGFTYLVSVIGITGARPRLPTHLARFIARVRPSARTPLAVGFGISTPAQATQVGDLADGVIVGSALIKTVTRAMADRASPAAAATRFVRGLRAGLNGRGSAPV